MGRAGGKAMAMAAAAVGIASALASAGPADPPGPRPAPRVSVVMAPDGRGGTVGGRARVLAGTVLSARVRGQVDGRATWALAYGDDVLAHGAVRLDAAGCGLVRIAAPDVHTRTVCRLLVRSEGGDDAVDVEVFPALLLASVAQRLAGIRVAVADPTGNVAAALRAEGLAVEPMETDIEKRVFDGDVAVLAGYHRPDALEAMCRALDGRLRRGMTLVALNPPPAWQAWGFGLRNLPESRVGRPVPATVFRQILQPGDIGTGHWTAALQVPDDAVPLVWLETEDAPPSPVPPGQAADALVAAGRVGRGRLIVGVLPELADPQADAVGRCVLGEMLLWSVRESDAGRSGPDR